MKIVIEYVLLENLLINLIILKTTALLTHEKGRLFLLSALLCAGFTVAMPAMALSTIGSFLIEIGLAMLTTCLSFKFKNIRKFVQLFLCHFVTSFIYGGACYFFESLFGITSLVIVLAVVLVTFIVIKSLIHKFLKKKAVENFCFEVTLVTGEKESKWKAFLDSGNMLFDPLTKNPVTLINYRVFSAIFPHIDIEDILRKSDKLNSLQLAHYINFNTLGNGDKILVFQVDKLCIDGHTLENPTLGLCLKSFNEAFGSDIILHNNCALNIV